MRPRKHPLPLRNSCFEGRPECAMRSTRTHAPPHAGLMRNAYGVGACTAVASPRKPAHCTAVVFGGATGVRNALASGTCAAACGPYAQCRNIGVCTAVASPREPAHCTAVALRGDRSAQCTRFRHMRRRVRALCAMHKCRGLRRTSHCTAVALRGDRSAQCARFRHQRRRVRALCAMRTVSGFAPQLHPHGTSLTAPQLL